MYSIGKKAAAAVMAGLMTLSALAPAAAFAVEPSVTQRNGTTQTGTGVTDVTVQYKAADTPDIGGTEDVVNNPDDNNDGLGDNVAFTVPISINYVADAAGKLTGPSKTAAYIENESAFSIHASAFRTEAKDGWTIVDDDTTTSTANAVDFQYGPFSAENKAKNADAYDYRATAPDKVRIADVDEDKANLASWNMAPKADTGVDDRVQLTTTGDIHNVSKDLTERTKMAEIHTYVTAGNAVNNTHGDDQSGDQGGTQGGDQGGSQSGDQGGQGGGQQQQDPFTLTLPYNNSVSVFDADDNNKWLSNLTFDMPITQIEEGENDGEGFLYTNISDCLPYQMDENGIFTVNGTRYRIENWYVTQVGDENWLGYTSGNPVAVTTWDQAANLADIKSGEIGEMIRYSTANRTMYEFFGHGYNVECTVHVLP